MEELLFLNTIKWIKKDKRQVEWTTVFRRNEDKYSPENIFAIMFPHSLKKKFLKRPDWNLNATQFQPGYAHYAGELPKYFRWGIDSKFEPITYQCFYNNLYPTKVKLIEEFKLYFNLYYLEKNNEYISVDISSNENVVVRISEDEINIKTEYLRKFLHAKNVVLGFQLDNFKYTSEEIENLPFNEDSILYESTNEFNYNINFQDSSFFGDSNQNTNSRLLAKCILEGFQDLEILTPFEELKNPINCDYIVDIDLNNGNSILENCCKSEIISDKEKYNFFTPVFFKREVLLKYYSNPNRYSVEDNSIYFQGSWRMNIDNNLDDCVCVYLGDLRVLPYEEQLYWKSYNIKPKEDISLRKFKLDFLSIYSDPEIEDLKFKNNYKQLNVDWKKNFGFKIFSELHFDDIHCFKSIRIPLNNDVAELDNLILNLAKLMIDYLNVKEINSRILKQDRSLNSIDKLDIFLNNIDSHKAQEITMFLKNLQKLRSTGSAHRKSDDYRKILEKMGINNKTEKDSFKFILQSALKTIKALKELNY